MRLKNNYKNILTPEQLKKLFAVSADKAIDLYNLANDMQRQTIIELVKQAKFNSENIDYNLLQKLSELSGIDLMNVEDATQIDVTK